VCVGVCVCSRAVCFERAGLSARGWLCALVCAGVCARVSEGITGGGSGCSCASCTNLPPAEPSGSPCRPNTARSVCMTVGRCVSKAITLSRVLSTESLGKSCATNRHDRHRVPPDQGTTGP
jgi:hypothetical protein